METYVLFINLSCTRMVVIAKKYYVCVQTNNFIQGVRAMILSGSYISVSFEGVDLSGRVLSGTFTDSDFSNADLTDATLMGDFTNVNFSGADLTGAVITGDFTGAIGVELIES